MLVTLENTKTYLGETSNDYDDFLTSQISLYSNAIENYCNRKFIESSYVETFYYSDHYDKSPNQRVELYHFPLNTISEVKEIVTENGTDSETVLNANEYRSGSSGLISRIRCGHKTSWFTGLPSESRIQVTYSAGFATLPEILENTVYRLVEKDYNKKKSGIAQDFGDNVQRVSIAGTISLDFDYSLQANERSAKFGMFIGNYSNVLDYYRSMRVLSGNIEDSYVS